MLAIIRTRCHATKLKNDIPQNIVIFKRSKYGRRFSLIYENTCYNTNLRHRTEIANLNRNIVPEAI